MPRSVCQSASIAAIFAVPNETLQRNDYAIELPYGAMPAALVEVAFITNPDEESKLKSDEFLNTVVSALTTAIDRYKTDYETRIGVIQPAAPVTGTTTSATKKAGGQ